MTDQRHLTCAINEHLSTVAALEVWVSHNHLGFFCKYNGDSIMFTYHVVLIKFMVPLPLCCCKPLALAKIIQISCLKSQSFVYLYLYSFYRSEWKYFGIKLKIAEYFVYLQGNCQYIFKCITC